MRYRLDDIAEILGCSYYGDGSMEIEALSIDSRHIRSGSGALFFAIEAARDGHDFALAAQAAGAAACCLSRPVEELNIPYLLIEDTSATLQKLAAHHRLTLDIPIIGITGSNAKTIVKEWLYEILSSSKTVQRSPRSFNSQLGVPLSVSLLDSSVDYGIIEAGISTVGEMQALQKIIKPTIGIFTNLGAAHDSGFESRGQKAAEKAILFQDSEVVICCADHQRVVDTLKQQGNKLFTWGNSERSDIRILEQRSKKTSCLIRTRFKQKLLTWELPFTAATSVENAMHCIAAALHLGIRENQIQERLKLLRDLPLRLNVQYGRHDTLVINDAYSLDSTSLEYALRFAITQKGERPLVLMTSDTDGDRIAQKEIIEAFELEQILHIGKYPVGLPQVKMYPSVEALLDSRLLAELNGKAILIKGARTFQLEQLAARLIGSKHVSQLVIDLSALKHNLDVYRSFLQPSTSIMMMVKAAAYGLGSRELVSFIHQQPIAYAGVAYTSEGIELREAGLSTPIFVMNARAEDLTLLQAYNCEPQITSLHQLQAFIKQLDGTASAQPLRIHLCLNTGMNRLGLDQDDLPQALKLIKQQPLLRVESILSHLSAADQEEDGGYTAQQINSFDQMTKQVADELGQMPKRHILNSAGSHSYPNAQYEMVRLGIGLYGIDERLGDQLQQVATLRSAVSQVRTVKAGQPVGYALAGVAVHDRVIATVALGYADGLPRALGDGVGHLIIQGQKAPIVGRVCMDMCMIDVTAFDQVNIGDQVTAFGAEQALQQLADLCDTIPYELLVRIPQRVDRRYLAD